METRIAAETDSLIAHYTSYKSDVEAGRRSPSKNLRVRLKNLAKVKARTSSDEQLRKIFSVMLEYATLLQFHGACHNFSAALHMLFTEAGLISTLCLGEVSTPDGNFFDHSWVEIGGRVFDVAVAFPSPQGAEAGGPLFASTDLDVGAVTSLTFGGEPKFPFQQDALLVLSLTLSEYASKAQMSDSSTLLVWSIARAVGKMSGMDLDAGALQGRYGGVTRTLKQDRRRTRN